MMTMHALIRQLMGKRGLNMLPALAGWALAMPAFALTPLEDTEMSGVTGQDGLTVSLESGSTLAMDQLEWRMDAGTANQASLLLRAVEATLVGGASINMDVGGDGTEAYMMVRGSWTDLQARLGSLGHSNLDRSVGIFGIESSGSLTFGNFGGPLNFGNEADPSTARSVFDLNTVADIYYRQSTGVGAPEISFGDLTLGFRFTDGAGGEGFGRFGTTADGLTMQADFMDFDLNFDLFFSPSTTQEFDAASRLPMILFGWEGGLENARISVGSGGIGYGSSADLAIDPTGTLQFFNYGGQYSAASDGLNIKTQWDFGPNFTWILGQAAGDRIRVDFFDWRRLGAGTVGEAAYDLRIPIYMDAINAVQGGGGICFGGNIPTSGSLTAASCTSVGGQLANVAPKDNNLAVLIRDGGMHAYNTQVRLNDVVGGVPVIDRFNWSLFYTFGKIDANLYFYPNGVYDAATQEYAGGLRSDVLVAIQSPGYWAAAQSRFAGYTPGLLPGHPDYLKNPANRWATNTHFLIADTDINRVAIGPNPSQAQLDARQAFGIGILNADLLWRVDDFEITLVGDTAPPTGNTASSDYYRIVSDFAGPQAPGLRLSTSNLAKYQFRGLFGGGNLNNLSDPVRISLLDVNLETDEFVFILGPPRNPGEQYVAFDALLNFNSNAYVSLAEPSSPTASVSLRNVQGQIAWVDGRVELESSATTSDGRPRLTIANDLLIGSTAFGGGALRGDVNFGADRLGSLVIPSAQIRSTLSLTPQ